MISKEANDYAKYQELHKHLGTKNYQIDTIFQKEFEIWEVLLDTVSKKMNVGGVTNPIDKENREGGRKKVSSTGEILDNGIGYSALKDGTMTYYNTYSNWIINGDKTEYNFRNVLNTEEQKNSEIWLRRFEEFYLKASYVHVESWNYYFKVENVWYEIKYNLDVVNEDFVKNHPPKEENDVRMMSFRDLCPDFFLPRVRRDTTFVNLKGYQQTDSEKGTGINPIDYSAGNYFLELYMPLGDTIKIKRHGSMGVNMQFYKIPVTHGGRNDVVFIVQEPNEMYPNREFGGMYIVRPRSLDQEEHGPHKSSADSFTSQFKSSRGNIDVVAKFLKPLKD